MGVGNDSGSGLEVGLLALHEQSSDGDTGIEVADEVGIENGSAVDAAAGGFEFFDDLHGADFGSAAEGAGGEAGGKGVHGAELGAEAALEGGDEVHHVGVALDEHEVANFYGSVLADAAEIVAAEIDEHDVFGAFFFVSEHFLFEGRVFGIVAATGVGAGDGAVFEVASAGGGADEHFGRGTDDVHSGGILAGAEAQEIHVGGRVDGAEGAVKIEGRDAGLEVPTLGEDDLEDVSGRDVLFGATDAFEELFFGGARLDA